MSEKVQTNSSVMHTIFPGIFEFVNGVVDDEKNHFGLKSAEESVKKEVMAQLMKGNNKRTSHFACLSGNLHDTAYTEDDV